jgi:hypothetical protein
MYIFMKVLCKTNLFIYFHISKLNDLKIFMIYILIFDLNIVQNDFIYQTGESIYAAQ